MRATHATRKKIEFPYTIDDTPLADTPRTSYLGVELSSDLRRNKQVKKTVAKGNQTLGVLKRNLKHCPRSIKDMAYKTILRPKLEYASAVWDPFTEDNIRTTGSCTEGSSICLQQLQADCKCELHVEWAELATVGTETCRSKTWVISPHCTQVR